MKKLSQLITVFFVTTTLLSSCNSDESASPTANGTRMTDTSGNPTEGEGGSMARFAISGNHLYTVDNSRLSHFDISNPSNPDRKGEVNLGFGVETIFPYQDKLFIGTQTGMYIMSIQNPDQPRVLSHYQHIFSCDPVVADSRYAYVTLSTGTPCGRGLNQLEIIDLQNITNPTMLSQYPMLNPQGLGIDGTNLFVCDDGLKLFDASNVMSIQQRQHFKINATDVIADNGNLLVIGSDGFYQYEYKNNNLNLLSKISVGQPL